MDYKGYLLSANADFTLFEFISTGSKGIIRKAIKYTQTLNQDVYNLGFGDIVFSDDTTIEIDDSTLSNNGDLDKVIATIVASIYVFVGHHPKAYVLFGSSNNAKLRLYRMFLSRHYEEISQVFVVFGAIHNIEGRLINVPFDPSANVEGYFIRKR